MKLVAVGFETPFVQPITHAQNPIVETDVPQFLSSRKGRFPQARPILLTRARWSPKAALRPLLGEHPIIRAASRNRIGATSTVLTVKTVSDILFGAPTVALLRRRRGIVCRTAE
jgi:hypothetical protein